LKQKNCTYDDLPSRLQGFFIDEARIARRKDYSETDEDAKNVQVDALLNEYGNNINTMRPLIAKTLQKGETFCKEYFRQREDLAYLAAFRKSVPYELKHYPANHPKNRDSSQYHEDTENILVEET
jgi:hypothetical protein